MTNQNQNSPAQPVLTDDEINDACRRHAADTGWHAENDRKKARAVESAVLSKLRAPVADPTDPGHDVDTLREHVRHLERRVRQLAANAPVADERAAFEAAWRELNSPWPMNSRMHDDGRYATPDIEREWRLWQARAALASAPAAAQGAAHGRWWNTKADPQERQRAWAARQSRLAQGGAPVAGNADELSEFERGFAAGWDNCVASAPVAGIPGYKLVPIEPTPQMIKAWHDAYSNSVIKTGRSGRAYAAMIGAAPAASAPVAGEAQPTDDELKRFARSMPARPWGIGSRQSDALAFARALLSRYAAPQARPSDDKLWDQTLTERDEYHDMADKLANAIADHLLVEIGEHSSSNCPWMRALEAIENAVPQASAEPAQPCTCPSGDGSLRHPCAVHPTSATQPEQGERDEG